MRKNIFADDRFIDRNFTARGLRDEIRQRLEFGDVHRNRLILHVFKRHHHFFKGRVPRPLSKAIDRHAQEFRARFEAGDRIGGRHPEIVMRVHFDRQTDFMDQCFYLFFRCGRAQDPQRVAKAEPVGPGVLGDTREDDEVLHPGPGSVLRVAGHIKPVAFGEIHGPPEVAQHPASGFAELMFDMHVRGGHGNANRRHAAV